MNAARKTDPADTTPRLSIVIPAYNESRRLGRTIEAVTAYLDQAYPEAELVIVDDGSRDETWSVIQAASARDGRVVGRRLQPNRGKGAAIREGILAARGDYIIFFDADLPFGLENVDVFVEALQQGNDVVIGARNLDPRRDEQHNPLTRRVASLGFNAFVELLLCLGIRDTQCGFKGFRGDVARAIVRHQTIDSFSFDVELLFLAKRWQLTIKRIPLHHVHQAGSTVSVFKHSMLMLKGVLNVRRNALLSRYPQRMPAWED